MQQTEAFGQPLEPEPGLVGWRADAAELARRDAEYGALYGPADAEDDIFGAVPPEHSWPGTALVWTLSAGGLFSVARILFLLTDTAGFSLPQVLGTLPMLLFPGLLLLWTAWKIREFRLTGLGVAMLLLLATLVQGVRQLLDAQGPADVGFGTLMAGLAVLWMGYLWTQRSDFT
jgi:hypothetical protein